MLLSMTGFGRATGTFRDKDLRVELRSLNSKQTDLRVRIPSHYRQREMELRKHILAELQRGKMELSIELRAMGSGETGRINTVAVRSYYEQLQALTGELGVPLSPSILDSLVRLPDATEMVDPDLEEGEYEAVLGLVDEAIEKLKDFRRTEGVILARDYRERVANIQRLLGDIEPYESQRVARVRERLEQRFEEYMHREKVDKNRFEQELIFYLEKYDLNEEKVRLTQHCSYFLEQLDNSKREKGRKLNFIAQEMGREINTIGSKANHPDIQHLVVQMKDELEKIKEQSANVL